MFVEAGSDLRAREVGERVLLTSGSTTYVIDKLVARALVARRPCAEDHRVMHLDLTPEGRALIESIFPAHAEALLSARSVRTGLFTSPHLVRYNERIRVAGEEARDG